MPLFSLRPIPAQFQASGTPSNIGGIFNTIKKFGIRRTIFIALFICVGFLFLFQVRYMAHNHEKEHGDEEDQSKEPHKLPLLTPKKDPIVDKKPVIMPGPATNPKEINLETYPEFFDSDLLQQLKAKDMSYLGVVMPTVPRGGRIQRVDYFTPTLLSYHAEMQRNPFLSRLMSMHVVNVRPGETNELFTKAKETYASKVYSEEDRKVWNFWDLDTGKKQYSAPDGVNHIPATTIRQTSDFINLINMSYKKSKYALYVEDDFLVCELALRTIIHIISKANARFGEDGWVAIRISSGLNGLIMRNDNQDIPTFAAYLARRIGKRPPDHLFTEFAARETPEALEYFGNRYMTAYKYNLLTHLGKVSTLRDTQHYDMPKCWEKLEAPVSFEVEAFDPKQCPNDDLWPCIQHKRSIMSDKVDDVFIRDINTQYPKLDPMPFGSDNNNPKH